MSSIGTTARGAGQRMHAFAWQLRRPDVVGVVVSALEVGPRGEVIDVSIRPVTKFGVKRP